LDLRWLSDFAGGFFEEFVDEGLVRLGLLGGHAAEPAEQLRGGKVAETGNSKLENRNWD
jgi:hypothetical protein